MSALAMAHKTLISAVILGLVTVVGSTQAAFSQSRFDAELHYTRAIVVVAERTGILQSAPLRAGNQFEADTLIMSLDCSIDEARLESLRLENIILQRRLEQSGGTSQQTNNFDTEIAFARNRVHRDVLVAEIEQCHRWAPWDGIVTHRYVQSGNFLRQGTPVLRIVPRDGLRVRAEIPISALPHRGQEALFWVAKHAIAAQGKTGQVDVSQEKADPLRAEQAETNARTPSAITTTTDVGLPVTNAQEAAGIAAKVDWVAPVVEPKQQTVAVLLVLDLPSPPHYLTEGLRGEIQFLP
ncbi:MAG: HlyD family secretion protein [Alphaproteobacteria bacterium]|nr:HlyD family secretion protein [Alphaproteobacteria bacterium]